MTTTLDQSKPTPHMHVGHAARLDQQLHPFAHARSRQLRASAARVGHGHRREQHAHAHIRTLARIQPGARWARFLVRTVGAA